jgi:hypothetical protein
LDNINKVLYFFDSYWETLVEYFPKFALKMLRTELDTQNVQGEVHEEIWVEKRGFEEVVFCE